MEPIWIWAIVVATSLVVEFATLQMVSIWIALGALVGLVLCAIGGISLEVQIMIGIVMNNFNLIFSLRIFR